MTVSLIYRHITLYRWTMSLLYHGQYEQRFMRIAHLLQENDKNVLELCFGDVVIANYCRNSQRNWTGMDINPAFVANARNQGFNAMVVDLALVDTLPKVDVCIMMGSLYHFHDQLERLFSLMCQAAPKIILTEPIRNLSQRNDLLGWLARRSANVGKGDEAFRFNRESLLGALQTVGDCFSYSHTIISEGRDMVVVMRPCV
ncbi:MAG: class I SAM-dependent methyltransferase [Magnetococcales bacterium]|nr:methyltransferase domain-containing protein [Magnetococcales bacterium]NGZ25799.1 class I SAM-dependent methyltransferase [Magnetococcales bacterium]